jgi:hypothetical protein
MEVLDRNPVLKKRLFKSMKALGIDPGRYIVGNDLNSLNPVTGQPEFFLKWVGRRLRKAAADISGYAAPIAGAMYGPAAGALVGGALGQYKRENPGDPSQWQQMALRGGISGLGTNIASGQGFTPFGGMRGVYDAGGKTWNPVELGKRFLEDPSQMLQTGIKGEEDRKWNFMEKYFPEKTKENVSNKVISTASDLKSKAAAAGLDVADDSVFITQAKQIVANETGIDLGKIALWTIPLTFGLGKLIEGTTSDEDVGTRIDPYAPHGKDYAWGPATVDYGYPTALVAEGGIMDLQGGGESRGPGTGTSDSIPAMLSDGEFVMTADAVRGAGGGDRREGARRMYEAMDRLEARA